MLAVFGPTASGKSGVAEAIADRIPATLISADAMQVYRGLPILTNQSARETELVAGGQPAAALHGSEPPGVDQPGGAHEDIGHPSILAGGVFCGPARWTS